MAIPLVAPAMAGLKALLAKGGVAAAAKSGLGAAKGLGTKAGIKGALKGGKRMAGDLMSDYMGGKPTVRSLADRFGMDAFFGGMQMVNTPGDLGDKLIAGATATAGGALGGIGAYGAAKGLTGKAPAPGLRPYLEMGGSLVGDNIAYGVADEAMRLKGGGMTPYEKQAAQADAQYRAQVEQELLAKLGMGGDPFLYENGLG